MKRRHKKRYVMLGYYGFNNFGDDLFNEAIVSLIKESDPNPNILIPATTSKKASEYSLLPSWLLPIWQMRNRTVGGFRQMTTLFAIIRSDVVIFGGGSLFQSGSRLRSRHFVVKFAKMMRKRIVAIGVSIGPVAKKDEGKLAAILRDIDCFGARDKSSLMFAKRHGLNQVYLTYDLALGYLGGGKTDAGTKVGIALHGERYRGRLKSKILDLISGRQEFVLISLDRENSAWVKEIHDDIMSCNKNARISVKSYNGFVDEILGIVLECDVFITSKLHGGISAYALNIPFILEEYHPKCTDFLHDIGWRLDLDAIDSLEEIKVRWRVGITPPDTKQIRAIQSAFPFSG